MQCKYCKLDLPLESFEVQTYKNKRYRRRKCRGCKAKDQRARREENSLWFLEYKKSLYCAICKNNDFRVLEFHHIGKKDINVSDMMTHSKKRIMEEICKCIVLCANCHRIETYKGN